MKYGLKGFPKPKRMKIAGRVALEGAYEGLDNVTEGEVRDALERLHGWSTGQLEGPWADDSEGGSVMMRHVRIVISALRAGY